MVDEPSESETSANIAVIGAGWWSQGWHLPCLDRNPHVNLVAIVDKFSHPTSSLNPSLESLESLGGRYGTRIFSSVDDLMKDEVSLGLDGVLIATPHATHYSVAKSVLSEGREKPLNVLMEKPMSTDIQHAIDLYNLIQHQQAGAASDKCGAFWINHSANFRTQTKLARETIASGRIGRIRHVTAFFASPLMWIFDDPGNRGWNEPTEGMIGNGESCCGCYQHFFSFNIRS